jgi:hypothetical protein
MRRRFPYLGNSYVGGSQGLHKRCSGGRYCGPFRRTPWSAWSGGRLRDRPSPSEQTCKNAAQSDWPRRGAPLARHSPLGCGRDSVPTRRACDRRSESWRKPRDFAGQQALCMKEEDMKKLTLFAAALLLASSASGYAAPKGGGNTGNAGGASEFSPGDQMRDRGGPTKGSRGASEFSPGDRM